MKTILILLIGFCFSVTSFSQENLVNANNNFAFNIYKVTKPDSNNFFISPFSLNIALAMASEGAAGKTREEIDNLLCIKDIENRSTAYKSLIEKSTNLYDAFYQLCTESTIGEVGENQLWIANSMWINDSMKLDESYASTINNYYNSECFHFNLNNLDEVNLRLQEWVSEKTNEKIKNISPLDKGTMLNLVNAIYFMGEWSLPFDENLTKEDLFSTLSKEEEYKKFMYQQTDLEYYKDLKIQSICIPYLCNQFSMMIILPNKKYGILDIEKKLDKAYFDKIKNKSESLEVILSLPKFKIETELKPKESIKNMGYTNMFSTEANFTNISQEGGLMIGGIIHKTYIEIDEKKTEAAAVTKLTIISYGVSSSKPPKPKKFTADHPFIFLIIDNRTNAVLFIGRFVK